MTTNGDYQEKEQSSKMYAISLYNLALLEMFGLVNITDNDSSIEKSWVIAKIQMSDFGAQWLALLKKINYNQFVFLIPNKYIYNNQSSRLTIEINLLFSLDAPFKAGISKRQ